MRYTETKPTVPRWIIILLIIFMMVHTSIILIQIFQKHHSLSTGALDLGSMDQAIWNTLHGRFFHQTNQPGVTNRLSLHVEPILIPISWLYLIHSGPETLFVFQTIIVSLGAIPVFALARRKLDSDALALIFALVYLLFPALQAASLKEFHAVTLAPPFLLAAFYVLETVPLAPHGGRRSGERKYNFYYFWLFILLALSCKEEISLQIFMIGLYALVIRQRYRLGLAIMILSLIWAYLAVFVIPPQFAQTQNIHWERYRHLGESPLDIVLNMLIQPQLFLQHLQAVSALTYFYLLLAPTAFLALLNPVTLLIALPSLGINLLSNFPPMQEVNFLIYAAPIVPALIISSIYGIKRLQTVLHWVWPNLSMTLSNCLLGSLILIASLIYQAEYGYWPGGGQFRGWIDITDHHRLAQRIFQQIPTEAALSAHNQLNPHVSQRETLYIFDRLDEADHVVLDVTLESWPVHPIQQKEQIEALLADDFGVIDAIDGYLLLARNQPSLPRTLPDAFFDFVRVDQPKTFTPQYPVWLIFDDQLALRGFDLTTDINRPHLTVVTLYWQALQPLAQDYVLWPFILNQRGDILADIRERPLVSQIWYPTSQWQPHEIIIIRMLPQDLGSSFTLALGVTAETWEEVGQRLSIRPQDKDVALFEQATWARLGTIQRQGRWDFQVQTRPVSWSDLAPQQARSVEFVNTIQLRGVDLPLEALSSGQNLQFGLYWQTKTMLPINLTTFVHLLDEHGQLVAQLDWTPQDDLGYLPTSAWQPNRLVYDKQQIDLSSINPLPGGEYHLILGWYDPITGDRLDLTQDDRVHPMRGNVVELGLISIQ